MWHVSVDERGHKLATFFLRWKALGTLGSRVSNPIHRLASSVMEEKMEGYVAKNGVR